jgi:hypothetical protein
MQKTITVAVPMLIMLLTMGCATQQQGNQNASLQPQDVVALYFQSWDGKDYPVMYAMMSDGFKKIEPTAETLAAFAEYASSQGIDNVRVASIVETSNDGKTATVDYAVEFTAGGKSIPFKGTFTLKYRSLDAEPGWKLIHPYGGNIDTS